MKTISIPKYNNPFTVNINNKEYTYKAGETIDVPDEVAEAIEDALELVPKPKRYLSKLAQLAEGSITKITASDIDGIGIVVTRAFSHCTSLESIEIPSDVTSIGDFSFYGCTNLKSIRFGSDSKLNAIGTYAFQWCVSLKSIYLPETPPVLQNVNAFQDTNTNFLLYCKTQASVDAYKVAPNWSTLAGTYSFVVEAK